MDIIDAFDLAELYDYPLGEIENAEWDLESEFGPTPPPEVQTRTDELAEFEKVKSVIKHMKEVGIRLDSFMAGLFYRNAKYTSDIEHMRGARKQLTQSPLLHTILNSIHTPSRYTGAIPAGASASMNEWAWLRVVRLAWHELNAMADDAPINKLDDDANAFPDLNYIEFSSLKRRVATLMPSWPIYNACWRDQKPRPCSSG
ncbi:hypothetical protein RhiJN_26673 [Ceratobasidium sp. AG-Ba]|nr:hypothetical protein RhiJN_12622 [Ceratobasidium sp. AG-Ba]QRV98654.1 hypothetical protein RhiJN_26673 [Ceratobasidium sp. AG-Ba]